MTKVFVTGAVGFVGRQIIKELASSGVDIMAMDKSDRLDNIEGIKLCKIDLSERDKLKESLADFKPDSIIHLAAIASPVYDRIGELYEINVRGSENLLDAVKNSCKAGTRVILTSTAGVYGNSDKEFISEDTEFNPQNHYSYSKMVMEYLSRSYADDLDIRIIRPFNIIGYGQRDDFLIPKLVKAYALHQPVLQVGNLATARDYVDIFFAAKIFCKMALDDNVSDKLLNICSGYGTTGNDVLRMLEQITDFRPKIDVADAFLRKNEIMRLVGDASLCNRFIGNDIRPMVMYDILYSMIQGYKNGN